MFYSVPELTDKFLSLFPHRQDYLFAKHHQPGDSPEWRTESRHPLSDRLIIQGSSLYGVRFGSETAYSLIDIDRGSPYHPARDRMAIQKIMGLLEPLGICAWFATTSSYSGGIHLWLPLPEKIKSWKLATAIATLLENGGYPVRDGQLEVFPNIRDFDPIKPNLFRGHRLPLQAGSYVIGGANRGNWEPNSSSPELFCHYWDFCKAKNDVQPQQLEQILKAAKRKRWQVSGKANKFLNDLNAEIEPGWTGNGQTNRLLGRIAMRAYCFGHILLSSTTFITGQALIDAIVDVATGLPGYADYCRHQHEIRQRAEEWADCIERSHYFPYRSRRSGESSDQGNSDRGQLGEASDQGDKLTTNQRRSLDARQRISDAIADMLNRGVLPTTTKERFLSLVSFGIGGETLYRHRDLWHPKHLWITPPDPLCFEEDGISLLAGGSSETTKPPSLLDTTARNQPTDKPFSDFVSSEIPITARNHTTDKASSDTTAKSDHQLKVERFMADHSEEIARISSYLRCLHTLDPEGEWSADPLLEMWRSHRFDMEGAAINALADYLKAYYQDLDAQALDYAAWEANQIIEQRGGER